MNTLEVYLDKHKKAVEALNLRPTAEHLAKVGGNAALAARRSADVQVHGDGKQVSITVTGPGASVARRAMESEIRFADSAVRRQLQEALR